MPLFDASDKQRIETAIAALETRTAAEVVVAVVPHSGRPWVTRAFVAFVFGLLAAVLVLDARPFADPRLALLVDVAVTFAVFALFGLQALERLLIAPRLAAREVEEHAFALFARRGLYRTQGHTGVLILLSELERRAVILGDEAIHTHLGEDGWRAHIDRIVGAIRSGQAADGVVDVLGRLTDVLAEIAPPVGANENELPNAVLDET
jgi:putative membrane protein